MGCLSVYKYIHISNPLPTVTSRSASSCSNSGMPEIASGRTRHAFGGAGCQRLLKGKVQLTIECQVNFFCGRLTSFIGHLGHEYQQWKFS